MTAIELDAFKMQLIRDILAIDSSETLDKVRTCVKGLLSGNASFDKPTRVPRIVEEVLSDVEIGLRDIEAGRVKSSEEVFKEMEVRFPWLCE